VRILWNDSAVIIDNTLILGDLHIGLAETLRKSGYRIPFLNSQVIAGLVDLISKEKPDKLVILGDLKDSIGNPTQEELADLEKLFDSIDLETVVVLGNHDGGLKDWLSSKGITWYPSSGFYLGDYFLFHGNAKPATETSPVLLLACHWHPVVRLVDENNRTYTEKAWVFVETEFGRMLMLPAFNPFLGGVDVREINERWIDMETAEIYLSDGTFLGKLQDLEKD